MVLISHRLAPAAGLLHRLVGHAEPQLSLLQQERLSSLRERAAVVFNSEHEAHQVGATLPGSVSRLSMLSSA